MQLLQKRERKWARLKKYKLFIEKIARTGLSLSRQDKFILSVGDEGAILTYICNAEPEHSIEITLSSPAEMESLQKLLSLSPKAPTYILLDIIDQNYVQQTLPGVNAFTIGTLVDKRIKKDYANDVVAALSQGRLKIGRKDWQYLFVSTPLIAPLSSWVDVLIDAPNPFAGIFMLPLETLLLTKALSKHIFTKDSSRIASNYQIILTHNKISGFRQTAVKEGTLLFTRVVDTVENTTPNAMANVIGQEVLNALEYLRRLSFEEDDGLDIFIVVSEEIKQALQSVSIKGDNIIILTPFEVAELVNMPEVVPPKSAFADILIATYFATHRSIMGLQTPLSKKLVSFLRIHDMFFLITACVIPIIIVMYMLQSLALTVLSHEIKEHAKTKAILAEQGEQVKKEMYKSKEDYVIDDRVILYKMLSRSYPTPIALLDDFSAIRNANVAVKTVEWKLKDIPKQGESVADINVPINFEVNAEFSAKGNEVGDWIQKFNAFNQKLKEKYAAYDVTPSKLPDQLNLDIQSTVIPMQMTITGPKQGAHNPQK